MEPYSESRKHIILVEFIPHSRINQNPWDKSSDPLWLLTPKEYEQVPNGTPFECISGQQVIKGIDYIDQDSRFGYIAFGWRDSWLPPYDVH